MGKEYAMTREKAADKLDTLAEAAQSRGDRVLAKELRDLTIGLRETPRIVLVMEGGLLQTVITEDRTEHMIVDYDDVGEENETVTYKLRFTPHGDSAMLSRLTQSECDPELVERFCQATQMDMPPHQCE